MPRNLHMEVHKVLCLSRIKCANLFINATSNGEPAPATGASGVTAIIGPMEVGGTLFQPLFQRAKIAIAGCRPMVWMSLVSKANSFTYTSRFGVTMWWSPSTLSVLHCSCQKRGPPELPSTNAHLMAKAVPSQSDFDREPDNC